MIFAAGDTETIVLVRPPATDTFGDPRPGPATETDIAGCLFAPGPSTENLDAADQVASDGIVYAPGGTDVTATDVLRIRGDLYEVAGEPRVWGNAGVELPVRRVTG